MAIPIVLPPHSRSREWRWTARERDRAIESGILRDPERWELVAGRLLLKMSKGTLHFYVFQRLRALMESAFREGWTVRPEGPVIASEDSEPEPDLAIAPGSDEDYLASHPRTTQLGLAIEIAVSSLSDDLGWKRDLYCQSGLSEYWVVDVAARKLLVHRQPTDQGYAEVEEFGADETMPGLVAKVREILPPS